MSELLPSALIVELRARAVALTRALRASSLADISKIDPRALEDAQRVVDASDRFEDLWLNYLGSEDLSEPSAEIQRKRRHDLRTPVGHVIGYLELLSESFEDVESPGPDLRAWMGEVDRLLGKAEMLQQSLDRELQGFRPKPSGREVGSVS